MPGRVFVNQGPAIMREGISRHVGTNGQDDNGEHGQDRQ
jgi:hypothetical protein